MIGLWPESFVRNLSESSVLSGIICPLLPELMSDGTIKFNLNR